jgi:hypothetical protein
MDPIVRRSKVKQVQLTLDVRVVIQGQLKAFPRTAADPSSDPPASATPQVFRTRTNQLLRESEAVERTEKARNKVEWARSIHKYWLCTVDECNNFRKWCYVHQATHKQYEIRGNEKETFALSLMAGECFIQAPTLRLIELWQERPNQLQVNPHNKRGVKKPADSASTSATALDDTSSFMKLFQVRQMYAMQNRLMQMQGQKNHTFPFYAAPPTYHAAFLLPASYNPAPSAPVLLSTPSQVHSGINSSPVNTNGQADTRSTVKEFLEWLTNEQPEVDRAEYMRTSEVIIGEMWTIGDLKDMSSSGSELYCIATSEPHRLKDGVIRHFKDDIQRFKPVFRLNSQGK